MSPAHLATLSLLDPDQGVCPHGHPCRPADEIGHRQCSASEYIGLPLICWEITEDEVDHAATAGATSRIVEWARLCLEDRAHFEPRVT
jgi:hypothetical protein